MPRIEHIYAFICDDAGPDDEGIAASTHGLMWMPLVGADMERMESLRPVAQRIATHFRKPIRLCRFTVRETLEIIQPVPQG